MSRDTLDRGSRVADLYLDHVSVVVAEDDGQISETNHEGAEHPGAVLVKAGPVLVLALDPYETARLEWARYGSEIGSRLGDD